MLINDLRIGDSLKKRLMEKYHNKLSSLDNLLSTKTHAKKSINEIAKCINKTINRELSNFIDDSKCEIRTTKEALRIFGFQDDIIDLIIMKGINSLRQGKEPFWGCNLISRRMIRQIIKKNKI